MDWLPLALISAFSLASADAATKAWLQGLTAPELAVARFGTAGVLMVPLLLNLPPLASLPAEFWWTLAVLLPLEVLALLLYLAAIRDHPLSLTLPCLAFTPVFAMGIAWGLLGERVTSQGAAGVVLVVTGAWMLNGNLARMADWRSWARPLLAILHEAGSRMTLIVAMIYALTSTLGKGAMRHLGPEFFGPLYFTLLGLAVTLLFALPRPAVLRRLATRLWAVLVVGALTSVMAYTHFLAIHQVEVAYMIAVKRTSLLFGILYGVLWFREEAVWRRLPAGALMVMGVFLIVL
jgi:drug/metabolite transporter (DMT)-like permease